MDDDGELPYEEEGNPFEKRAYAVGYGKPPREHRFGKGNTAARGKHRKRRDKALIEILMKIAGETVEVTHHNRKVRMTRREALARTLFDRAMRSPRDALRLATLLREVEDSPAFTVEDRKITIEFVGPRSFGLPGEGVPPGEQSRDAHSPSQPMLPPGTPRFKADR